MKTPFFTCWRSPLAALGRRTLRTVRQATLAQLQEHLRDLLPAALLWTEDEGLNSRERIYSLRLTFECFVWQILRPHAAEARAGSGGWENTTASSPGPRATSNRKPSPLANGPVYPPKSRFGSFGSRLRSGAFAAGG